MALTRALAYDPEILILDEATSSVDSATKAMLQEGIKTLLANRTALVIAHRLSTIREMDRILVLHHGHLMEEGTHDALLAASGLYARLYALQFAAEAGSPDAPLAVKPPSERCPPLPTVSLPSRLAPNQ